MKVKLHLLNRIIEFPYGKFLWEVKKRAILSKNEHIRNILFFIYSLSDNLFFPSRFLPSVNSYDNSRCEVHSTVCERDFNKYLLAIKSFIITSKLNLKIVVHDDGTLTWCQKTLLSRHIKNVHIIDYKSSRTKIKAHLEKIDRRLLKIYFNDNYPIHFNLQTFDTILFSNADKIIQMDCDIVFLNKPNEVIAWVKSPEEENVYNWEECPLVPPAKDGEEDLTLKQRFAERFNVKNLSPNCNVGFMCFYRNSFDPLLILDVYTFFDESNFEKECAFAFWMQAMIYVGIISLIKNRFLDKKLYLTNTAVRNLSTETVFKHYDGSFKDEYLLVYLIDLWKLVFRFKNMGA